MAQEQYARIEALVSSIAPQWQERLGLAHWIIEHHFADTTDSEDQGTVADAHCQWQYLRADITWFLPMAVACSDERIELTLVHELVHPLLAPEQAVLKAGSDEQSELATEMVTRAVYHGWGSLL